MVRYSFIFATDQGAGGTQSAQDVRQGLSPFHQQGIIVILDVCFNHFDPEFERAEWAYDLNDHTRNIYY